MEKQIIKPTFKNFLEKQISSNENKNEKIFIKTYLEYHEIYSNTSAFVKNSLNEVENYYFKKTDIKTNSLARRVMHDVGWRYKTKINFIDLEKSFFYLSEVVKYETDDYFLKYYLNNLGTIYDSYYGVKSLPISKKKATTMLTIFTKKLLV